MTTQVKEQVNHHSIVELAQSFEKQEVNALLIYQSAILIYNDSRIPNKSKQKNNHNPSSVQQSFQRVLEALPTSLLQSILEDINQAFLLLTSKQPPPWNNNHDIQKAVHALIGIYTTSPKACSFVDTDLIVALVEYYESCIHPNTISNTLHTNIQMELQGVLQLLSCFFLDGMLSLSNDPPTLTTSKISNHDDDTHDNRNYEDDLNDPNDMDSLFMEIMEIIQLVQNYSETCLGELQKWQQQQNPPISLIQSIRQTYETTIHNHKINNNGSYAASEKDDTQLSYLLDMLQSSPTRDEYEQTKQKALSSSWITAAPSISNQPSNHKTKSSSNTIKDPILPLIQQVQSVYPNLGQGYIEIALACYNFNPSLLITQLSSVSSSSSESFPSSSPRPSLHPRLLGIDTRLPRQTLKRQEYNAGILPNTNDSNREDKKDQEARQAQKQFLSNMMKEEENDHYIITTQFFNHDVNAEYDDDYDDQYDGIGNDGKVGASNAMDDTAWDDTNNSNNKQSLQQDYEAVKRYNAYIKNQVAEESFWNEMENHNRKGGKPNRTENHEEEEEDDPNNDSKEESNNDSDNPNKKGTKQWGPNKGKGGRLIGPDGKYLPFPKKGNRKQTHIPTSSLNDPTLSNRTTNENANANPRSSKGKGNARGAGTDTGAKKNNNHHNNKHKKEHSVPGNKGENVGNTSNSTSNSKNSEMSKIQKRRKNDNKAKIGNHNRKERATRKTGGM